MNSDNELTISWFGVIFERVAKEYKFNEELINSPLRDSKKSNERRSFNRHKTGFEPKKSMYEKKFTVVKLPKKFIVTPVPFRLHNIFNKMLKDSKNSFTSNPGKLSKERKWSIDESYSTVSLGSYGMLDYKTSNLKMGNIIKNDPAACVPKPFKPNNMKGNKSVIEKDISTKPTVNDILEGYVKEIILQIPPKMNKNIKGWNISEIIQHTIVKKEPVLHNFLKKDFTFFPERLRKLIADGRELRAMTKPISESDDVATEIIQMPRQIAEDLTITIDDYKYSPKNDVSFELLKDNYEFKRFIQHLLLVQVYLTKPSEEYMTMTNKNELSILVNRITEELNTDYDTPDADIRREILVILKSCKINLHLLKFLSLNSDSWYEALLAGLFSNYLSIIQDTCLIISFICFQPLLAETIINNCQFDVAKDTITTLLKAMEAKPDYFSLYSIAASFVIGCCERFSILETLIDRIIQTKQKIIMDRWPDFVYYATKFWKTENLVSKQQIVYRIIQHLEFCLFNRYSSFHAKRALSCFCKRCSFPTKFLTLWPL